MKSPFPSFTYHVGQCCIHRFAFPFMAFCFTSHDCRSPYFALNIAAPLGHISYTDEVRNILRASEQKSDTSRKAGV